MPFFGHPASLPAGPALLADESGSPIYVMAVRRVGPGRYRGGIRPLPRPDGPTRRSRVVALLEAEARIFESIIASAPDQWWGCFFPIWPDLERPASHSRATGPDRPRATRPESARAQATPPAPGREAAA